MNELRDTCIKEIDDTQCNAPVRRRPACPGDLFPIPVLKEWDVY